MAIRHIQGRIPTTSLRTLPTVVSAASRSHRSRQAGHFLEISSLHPPYPKGTCSGNRSYLAGRRWRWRRFADFPGMTGAETMRFLSLRGPAGAVAIRIPPHIQQALRHCAAGIFIIGDC